MTSLHPMYIAVWRDQSYRACSDHTPWNKPKLTPSYATLAHSTLDTVPS